MTIRSKATTKSTAVGVLYKTHKFSVAKKSGNWLYITDKTTGVKGWVSGTYVYRDARMCLDPVKATTRRWTSPIASARPSMHGIGGFRRQLVINQSVNVEEK